MSGPLIYDRGMRNSTQAYTDKAVIKIILEKLTDQHVFINTTWISKDPDLENVVSKNKIAVCYSGSDWENTNCQRGGPGGDTDGGGGWLLGGLRLSLRCVLCTGACY